MDTARIVVHGRVQGVGYRYFAVDAASDLGIQGWVRNRSDGTVEIMAQGERSQLEALLSRCHEGPPLAMVRRVDVERDVPVGDFTGFEVRYT